MTDESFEKLWHVRSVFGSTEAIVKPHYHQHQFFYLFIYSVSLIQVQHETHQWRLWGSNLSIANPIIKSHCERAGSKLFSCVLSLDLWTLRELNRRWSTTSLCATVRYLWSRVKHRKSTELHALSNIPLTAFPGVLTGHCRIDISCFKKHNFGLPCFFDESASYLNSWAIYLYWLVNLIVKPKESSVCNLWEFFSSYLISPVTCVRCFVWLQKLTFLFKNGFACH